MTMLIWALLGALIGVAAAQRKGFSVAGGILGGLLLGPLAVLMFAVSGVSKGDKKKKCPSCAEWIKLEAKVCPHCRRDVVALLACGLLLPLLACASAPPPNAAITEADEAMIAECKFLGSVDGHSLLGGAATTAASRNAKKDALANAHKLGATHVVFDSVDGGGWASTGQAHGRAYKCPG